ncbi:MAG: alpha/beta fold hydrolase [Catenulispora sp.]|nr:alpha/beta fold hydrolase [Catenulispora sp.]
MTGFARARAAVAALGLSGALLASVLTTNPAATAATTATAANASPDPSASPAACAAARVAPDPERPVNGSTAVLFVHGFVSSPGIWAQGAGTPITWRAAQLPGLTAWTFDYAQAAANWVDDPRIGPALAKTITCLAKATGAPVVVVGHSMGGLATQYALSQIAQESAPAGSVAEVITIGTPFQGSLMETVGEAGLTAAEQIVGTEIRASDPILRALNAIRSQCADAVTADARTLDDSPCGLFAMGPTPAGKALMYKSDRIQQLPPWPSGVKVFPIAADIRQTFGVGDRTVEVSLGDVPVSVGSGTAYSSGGSPHVFGCDNVSLRKLVFDSDDEPCYHHNLPHNADMTAAVLDELRHYATSSSGGVLTEDEGSVKVSVVPTSGSTAYGPVLGPDGHLWLVAADPTTKATKLQEVDPATGGITDHPLSFSGPDGTPAVYSGSLAFDGAGHLWIAAAEPAATTGGVQTDILLSYSKQAEHLEPYPVAPDCAPGLGLPSETLYSAGDGAVWVICGSKTKAGGSSIERLFPESPAVPAKPVIDAQPGSLLYLGQKQLADDSMLSPMAPSAGGTMWNIAGNYSGGKGFVEFTPSGEERLTEPVRTPGTAAPGKPAPSTELQVVGNGSAPPAALGTCLAVDDSGGNAHSTQCVIAFTATDLKVLASLPDYNGYNMNQVNPAAMDSSGAVWVMLQGKAGGKAADGQYYAKVAADGTVTVYPFTVPKANGPIAIAKVPPVITADGGLWSVDASSSPEGQLVEVLPKQ